LAQVNASHGRHAIRADQNERRTARGEEPIGERDKPLGIGDDGWLPGAVSERLPNSRDDDIAQEQDNAKQVNDFERIIGHGDWT